MQKKDEKLLQDLGFPEKAEDLTAAIMQITGASRATVCRWRAGDLPPHLRFTLYLMKDNKLTFSHAIKTSVNHEKEINHVTE